MTKEFIFDIHTMYYENTKAYLLVRVLRKQGWAYLHENDEAWLVKGNYHIELGEVGFTLFCNVKQGDTLSHLLSSEYGRRQSQSIKRAVAKHKRETEKCTSINSNSTEEQRR